MEELSALRRSGALAIGAIAWACVAVIGIGCFYSQQGWSPLLIAIAVSLIPTMIVGSGRTDTASRIALGLTLPLYPAILLYQWSGAAWQIDIHMIFFAAIATLVVLADWRPIIAGAGVTAVHHLLANLIMPTLVFPGGANLERVLLHAVIVIVETAALVWLSVRLEALILGQAASRAERDRLEASAAEERERTAAEQDLMIRSIGVGLNALSEGNLEYQIAESFPSAYERLRHDFNQAGTRLCGMVRSVADAAACIHSGSSEIRVASDDLATRTERQAASLEETASAMREVTSMVQEAARNAAAVNTAIGEAHREADEGGQVVERAVVAMNAIERSSKEINDIINVIDGIAFQTNLLALNAGVEAARAGETGKGFAVVANEVRALAQRSADAARNIRELITTSTDQVDQGVSLVGETGRMLSRIVQRVGEISKLIGTISESTEIQAENLRQVNGAVGEMDKMTQQNAAMVEESTAASRSLAGEATELADLVSRFRTGGTPTVAVRQAPSAPKPAVARAAPVHGNLALKAEVVDDADWQEF